MMRRDESIDNFNSDTVLYFSRFAPTNADADAGG